MAGVVVATASSAQQRFTKPVRVSIRLISGLGVEGTARLGTRAVPTPQQSIATTPATRLTLSGVSANT
jgi:hypothetical protein